VSVAAGLDVGASVAVGSGTGVAVATVTSAEGAGGFEGWASSNAAMMMVTSPMAATTQLDERCKNFDIV
jgi:hypothetical protein